MLKTMISKLTSARDFAQSTNAGMVAMRANSHITRISLMNTGVDHFAVISAHSKQAVIHNLKAEYFELLETADLADIGDNVDCAYLARSAASDVLKLLEGLK